MRSSESEVWRSLAQFDQPEPLDHKDRMQLRELLTRAEQLNEVTPGNFTFILALARPLHIRPVAAQLDLHLAHENDFCKPLLSLTSP